MMAGHYELNSITLLQARQRGNLEIVWERLSAAIPLLPGMAATTEQEPCCRVPPLEGPLQIALYKLNPCAYNFMN
jgi:hypothetical protein